MIKAVAAVMAVNVVGTFIRKDLPVYATNSVWSHCSSTLRRMASDMITVRYPRPVTDRGLEFPTLLNTAASRMT